tara:strand:- start:129 stop:539 length:411 start_codon:yes stop_codon:yes gene_type:complete
MAIGDKRAKRLSKRAERIHRKQEKIGAKYEASEGKPLKRKKIVKQHSKLQKKRKRTEKKFLKTIDKQIDKGRITDEDYSAKRKGVATSKKPTFMERTSSLRGRILVKNPKAKSYKTGGSVGESIKTYANGGYVEGE